MAWFHLLLTLLSVIVACMARDSKILSTIDEQETKRANSNISSNGSRVVKSICDKLQHTNGPVILLLHDKPTVLLDAAKYINNILEYPNVHNQFWLMKFNSTGPTNILAKTTDMDINEFKSIIEKKISETNSLGISNSGGAVFFSILNAIKYLPIGGSVMVFTDEKIEDEDLATLTYNRLITMQIQVYTVWLGIYPSLRGEEKVLQKVSELTHGGFFVANFERDLSSLHNEAYLQTNNTKEKSLLVYQININTAKNITVPIDKGVTSIHISLAGDVSKANFISPKGYLIELLNATSVGRFSRGSFVVNVGDIYDIELNTAQHTPTPVVGIWRLETDAVKAFAREYNLTVTIENDLVLNINTQSVNKQDLDNFLELHLNGGYNKINEITLLDNSGAPLPDKLQYNEANDVSNENFKKFVDIFSEKEIKVSLEKIPQQTAYIQLTGKDSDGNDFTRLSYIGGNRNYQIETVTIEVSDTSKLLVGANQNSVIYFEVTNNKNQAVFANFQCHDEKRLLQWMQPMAAWLSPQQTIVVTVNIYSRPTAGIGYDDLITFRAITGSEKYEKGVLLTVTESTVNDNESPHMWHKFTSDCLNVLLTNCKEGTWTIQVTAQDMETGLLQLTSSPPGLNFPDGFISGTKNEVNGYLSGSCCNSNIQLTSVDRYHNRRVYVADAYKSSLNPGAIAAIVLSVLLLLLIIILIIVGCQKGWCRRKESGSMDLPTASYRGPVNSASTKRY